MNPDDYTAQELNDLRALRSMRSGQKKLSRSGNPAIKAQAEAYLRAIRAEILKIHTRAQVRAEHRVAAS